MRRVLSAACLMGLLVCGSPILADPGDLAPLMAAVNSVGPKGEGHLQAITACRQLLAADAEQLPAILRLLEPDAPLASNWLRPVIEAIADRARRNDVELPLNELKQILDDQTLAPRARRIAYELILAARPDEKQQLAAGLLNDPSPELRRDAVALALQQAKTMSGEQAITAYRAALNAARDQDQIEEAASQLRALGQTVDVAKHFGFLQRWRWVGPFDNTDMKGFDIVYGPEKDASPDATYPGKNGPVQWKYCETDDEYGLVDLNQIVGKLKASVVYLTADFKSPTARDVDIRLGCINANKVWLNGQLVMANNIYHSGTYIDQYIGKGQLKAGNNRILVKVLQNNQTEDWAQRWQFQLRVCDRYGTAVLSAGREEETKQ